MPNTGDFDPAKAIDFDQDKARQDARQQQAAEEVEKQRRQAQQQAQEDLRRTNLLKLLRYADEQLEEIRNPVVSEFVVTEMWCSEGFFRKRIRYHQREQARYRGLWLALKNNSGRYSDNNRSGLVKLRQPHAGYAYVYIDGRDNDWDPRKEGHFLVGLTALDRLGTSGMPEDMRRRAGSHFQTFASLEEVAESIDSLSARNYKITLSSAENLTESVTRALNFVATGHPPKPRIIEYDDQGSSSTDTGGPERPWRAATVRTSKTFRPVEKDQSPTSFLPDPAVLEKLMAFTTKYGYEFAELP